LQLLIVFPMQLHCLIVGKLVALQAVHGVLEASVCQSFYGFAWTHFFFAFTVAPNILDQIMKTELNKHPNSSNRKQMTEDNCFFGKTFLFDSEKKVQ